MAEPSKSSHELANEKISAAIQEIYKEHPDKGHRRIRGDLEKDYDIQISPKLGTEVGPVFPPRLCDLGIFIVPVLRKNLQSIQSSLLWASDSFVDENTLTVNVNRLRRKLDGAGLTGFITTKFGVGYLLGD